jgi:hypothetical protein
MVDERNNALPTLDLLAIAPLEQEGRALMLSPLEEKRLERQAKNQVLFRSINELIEDAKVTFGDGEEEIEVLCECSSACTQVVVLTHSEYEVVRAGPTLFVIVPSHEAPAIERVVSQTDRFAVVETFGMAARAAVESDPRANTT